MDELVIFPWWRSIDRLRPERDLRIGRWKVFPFEQDTDAAFPPRVTEVIRRLLSAYVDPQNRQILACSVAKVEDVEWFAPTRDAFEADNLVAIVTAAGLANRRFFQDGLRYSTAIEFEGQCWSNVANAEGITDPWRRKDGDGLGFQHFDRPGLFRFPLPHFPNHHQDLDWKLANAIIEAIRAPAEFSSNLVSALHCFNLSNTDHQLTPASVELTLLSGAFDRLIEGTPQGHEADFVDGMKRLREQAGPVTGQLPDERMVETPGANDTAFDIWTRDFYRARGDLAHGRQQYIRPRAWSQEEHILLGVFLFPLLLRAKLQARRFLSPEDSQQGVLQVFEDLLHLHPLEHGHQADREEWRRIVLDGEERDRAPRLARLMRQNAERQGRQ